jgi:Ca2+-binding RTX toxin-like protein
VIVGAPAARPNGNSSGASYVVFGNAEGFAANLRLSSLNGRIGFQISGEGELDYSGTSVASAGDINGDGFADLIVGAPNAEPSGNGASYVVFGKAGDFAANLQLSSLNGGNGFKIGGNGISGGVGDTSGRAVAGAGDVNGDGFADVIIASGSPGASFVVFGKAEDFASQLQLTSLDGANGFKISGGGRSVASAGDVNGDGLADIIIGSEDASPNGINSGASYVIFGTASGFASNLQLSSLDGVNGFKISGEAFKDLSGRSVASAGDVNGDGFDDVIIGAPNANRYGASYVVFGTASGFASNVDLSSLDGTNGFKINRGGGVSVASAGDVNGDGFDDLVVGNPGDDPNGPSSGASYVIFGHRAFEAVNRVGSAIGNVINGGAGDDTVRGLGGDDRLIGWEGDDRLFGGVGEDWLNGRSGRDLLNGGAGRDVLIGGFGEDRFDFNAATDSGTSQATRDVIRDFKPSIDHIDLSGLGALSFIGTDAFSAAGQVRAAQAGASSIVQVNLTGTGGTEMTIVLRDVIAASLSEEDFIL